VYIYGGGFATGSASNPTNDGGNQAARGDVVVVDIAYRLNSLGFLALDDGVHNGNYWISDLISGLEWIQKYIAAVGGGLEKIIIYGESAGAQSVQALLASAKAIGLFRGDILQSNYLLPYVPLAEAINQTTNPILHETGCASATDQLACLQAYNATALIYLKTNFNYPVVDGTYLLSTYINLNASAANNISSSVPVITGANRDEAGVLVPLPSSSNYKEAIHELAASQPQDTPNVTTIPSHRSDFPVDTGPSLNNTPINQIFNTTTRIYTDTDFHCSDEYTALAAVRSGIWPKVWYYELNRTYQDPGYNMNGVCQAPFTSTHPYGDPELEYFKCHAGDLANNFGNVARVGFPERDQYDIPFGQLAVNYWTSFARTLDPNPDPGFLRARGYWNTLGQIQV
jgi:carboxylesterase type B